MWVWTVKGPGGAVYHGARVVSYRRRRVVSATTLLSSLTALSTVLLSLSASLLSSLTACIQLVRAPVLCLAAIIIWFIHWTRRTCFSYSLQSPPAFSTVWFSTLAISAPPYEPMPQIKDGVIGWIKTLACFLQARSSYELYWKRELLRLSCRNHAISRWRRQHWHIAPTLLCFYLFGSDRKTEILMTSVKTC